MNFIDLFAGAGGLSEGFIQAGYTPLAHVEADRSACDTLITRTAFHYLKQKNELELYYSYLKKELSRSDLLSKIPKSLINTVIHKEISSSKIDSIFAQIDDLLNGESVNLIIGGPPCQAYSLVGRAKMKESVKNDPRNFLYEYYAQFLDRYKPKYFVFENVLGLLSAGNRQYFENMQEKFESIGYKVNFAILNAHDFNVLQNRKRVIIIGTLGVPKFDFNKIKTSPSNWKIKNDLFFDLPQLLPGEARDLCYYTAPPKHYLEEMGIRNCINFVTQHITRDHNKQDLKIYKEAIKLWLGHKKRLQYDQLKPELQSHKNKTSFLDRFKVIDPETVSHTLVAHISKDGHYYIYPDLNQVRSISVREAARIQSFPDDYFFEGGRTAAFRQIGNAVPPLMAKEIAKALM